MTATRDTTCTVSTVCMRWYSQRRPRSPFASSEHKDKHSHQKTNLRNEGGRTQCVLDRSPPCAQESCFGQITLFVRAARKGISSRRGHATPFGDHVGSSSCVTTHSRSKAGEQSHPALPFTMPASAAAAFFPPPNVSPIYSTERCAAATSNTSHTKAPWPFFGPPTGLASINGKKRDLRKYSQTVGVSPDRQQTDSRVPYFVVGRYRGVTATMAGHGESRTATSRTSLAEERGASELPGAGDETARPKVPVGGGTVAHLRQWPS